MASHIKRGESLFIPFGNDLSISDSQNKPRMYKTVQMFEKAFPKHHFHRDGVELVEYAEVRHGRWQYVPVGRLQCMECKHYIDVGDDKNYCPNCGAKMDGGAE